MSDPPPPPSAPTTSNGGLRPWRERLAGLLLLGGLAVAGVVLQREWPRTHHVALRLDGPTASVLGMEVTVLSVGGEVDPIVRFRRSFPTGAPRIVPVEVRTSDHEVDIEVRTELATRAVVTRKRIALHPDEESTFVLVRLDDREDEVDTAEKR